MYLFWFVLHTVVWAREAVSLRREAESKLLRYKWEWHRISLPCKLQKHLEIEFQTANSESRAKV